MAGKLLLFQLMNSCQETFASWLEGRHADVKWLRGDAMSIDTAALTGEPVARKCPSSEYGSVMLSGTTVKAGECYGEIVAAGTNTEMGQAQADV